MLYLCATPIGNLQDVTYRLVNTLKEVDEIYAEDTRRTLQLLNHLDIKKPIFSCHEHNEKYRSNEIIAKLKENKNLALVSDAGMPAISDPGYDVVKAVIEAGQEFTIIPGPCAAVSALVLSGIDTRRFAFEGFLGRSKKEILQRLSEISQMKHTMIFYESPLRLKNALELMMQVLGNRNATVCREITKMHEQSVRGKLDELIQYYQSPPKGECVIVVEGNLVDDTIVQDVNLLIAKMNELIASGVKIKDAAKQCAAGEFSANDLYQLYIKN